MNYFYVFIGLYLTILAFKTLLTIWVPKQKLIDKEPIDLSQITIVQPILSGNLNLEETLTYNLHSNSEVNYLWLIDNNDVNAQELTSNLKKDFEHINIQILSYPNCPDQINPKVFKLNKGIKKVLTDYVIVLDANAMLNPETLKDLIINLKDNDLTTGLPIYKDNDNFWCKLMTQFVNNNSAMTYLPLLWLWKPISINGMCYAMKLQTIQQLGYFEKSLSDVAEDLSLALIMKEKGMKIFQSRKHILLQANIENRVRYMNLMQSCFLLTKLLIKNNSLKESFAIIILHVLPPLMLWMILLYSIRDVHYIILPLFLILRLLMIKIVQKIIFNNNNLYQYGYSLLAELMQPYHLFQAFIKK